MTDAETSARQQHAAAEWAALRGRLRTITPQAIGRSVVALAAIGGTLWLAAATWPALLPFVVGGLIAYQLLPVVDGLDRVLPRGLAALLSVVRRGRHPDRRVRHRRSPADQRIRPARP